MFNNYAKISLLRIIHLKMLCNFIYLFSLLFVAISKINTQCDRFFTVVIFTIHLLPVMSIIEYK